MRFNAPAQKLRRSNLRKRKAQMVFPRPAQYLQPIANCQSQRYNHKTKLAKGFSLLEIEQAGLNIKRARELRIRVDPRRITKSKESCERNVLRLKDYLGNLTFFKSLKEVEEANVQQFCGRIKAENKRNPVTQVIKKSDIEDFTA